MTFTKITSISNIRKNIKQVPKLGGVYKHYINADGLKYLDNVCPTKKEIADDGKEVHLIYIGKAKDLFDRFKWHLGITNSSHKSILGKWLSTLRHSYMANHTDIDCLSQQDVLDSFMDEYTYAQYMVTEDFDNIEQQLIKENDLPLNIQDNIHVFVKTNKIRRDDIYYQYKQQYTNIEYTQSKKTITKIDDKELREYARIAEKEGILNKSNFLRWFRDIKRQSAAQNRLYKAWDERYSDVK